MYEDAKGKPTKAQLKQLSKDTGLKLQQVYKWYWDTEKKNDKLQQVLMEDDPEVQSPQRISRKILKTQYTDEFGGYSKTWFTDGLTELRNQQENGTDKEPAGETEGGQCEYGMDFLAKSLGLDIEKIAIELAMQDDTPPTQTQIIEGAKVMNSEKVEKRNASPVITPKVIRPETSQIGSPFSSYSQKQPAVASGNYPTYSNRDFTADKINQAFQNLFGGFGNDA